MRERHVHATRAADDFDLCIEVLRERDGTRCERVVWRVKVVTVLLMFACFGPGSKYHVAATFANGYLEIRRLRGEPQ